MTNLTTLIPKSTSANAVQSGTLTTCPGKQWDVFKKSQCSKHAFVRNVAALKIYNTKYMCHVRMCSEYIWDWDS